MNDPNSPSRKTPVQFSEKSLYECRCGFQTYSEEKLETHYDNAHNNNPTQLKASNEALMGAKVPTEDRQVMSEDDPRVFNPLASPQSTQPNKLDDLLDNFLNKLPIKTTEIGWEAIGEDSQDFKQALITYFLEIVGEDDSYGEMCEHCNDWDDGRNALRAELRQQILNIKGEK